MNRPKRALIPMQQPFESILAQRLQQALLRTFPATLPEGFTACVEPATDSRFGDYQTNAAMLLARPLRKNPRLIAEEILRNLESSDLSEQPEIAGAGFINFRIHPEALGKKLLYMLGDTRLGTPKCEEPLRIVIDFSSPNVAKPMHIGHIRSTLIGDALGRIARFIGHTVILDNHIGDWGTQFGMVIYGLRHYVDREALQREPMMEIVRVYKKVNQHCKEDDGVLKSCREELVKLQQGDGENLALWRESVELSKKAFHEIYRQLDIHFDYELGESFYNDQLQPLVDRLMKSGLAEVSQGAACIFFRDIPGLAETPCIIRKGDGGFNYATTDLATLEYRHREWKADAIWYVVGAPQKLHFEQVFAAARRMGLSAELKHIAFGNILNEDRKLMKTRSGDHVLLQDVLSEAIARAKKVIEEKKPDLSEEEQRSAAEIIGIGSIKYFDLSQSRVSDYVFSWDKMLALNGNTAPYLCYVYVRIRSIFRKAQDLAPNPAGPVILAEKEERALALKLAQFSETVPVVLVEHRPNVLAGYLYELARTFHAFFEACPVLKSEGDTQNSRLILCRLTADVLKKGLELLGIRVPERM